MTLQWITNDVIARAGKTTTGLSIFYIVGLGYWACPPTMLIVGAGDRSCVVRYPDGSKSSKQIILGSTPEHIKHTLFKSIDELKVNHGLYKIKITTRDLVQTIKLKPPYRARKGYFYVRILPHLKKFYGGDSYRVEFSSVAERTIAKQQIEHFIRDQRALTEEEYAVPEEFFKQFYSAPPVL